MRWIAYIAILASAPAARAAPTTIRCDDLSTADLSIDGLLDDWPGKALARIGTPADGAMDLRCSWDGTAIAFAIDVRDDRVVRVRGKGSEDQIALSVSAGGAPARVSVRPGNPIARSRIHKPRRVAAADSLQPKGFSIEARIPAVAIAAFSGSTPTLDARLTFTDADQAMGGDTTTLALRITLELPDRKALLDDFLRSVKLRRTDLRFDRLAELDPDRRGKERIVAGGTVIGILTDQFAFVSLPAARPADVRKLELIPLGTRGQRVVSATVRQTGNGGSRDLLMLWTVWSGQLQPLAQIEIRKERGGNVLEATWKVVRGKRGPELHVTPRPAIGWTAETWNEVPAGDADPILLPWDRTTGGIAYTMTGVEIARRDLPAPKQR